MTERRVTVEVCYALSPAPVCRAVTLATGATVARAIQASALPAQYPEINLDENKVGLFGKTVALDTLLQTGDRIEIYLPARGKRKAKS